MLPVDGRFQLGFLCVLTQKSTAKAISKEIWCGKWSNRFSYIKAFHFYIIYIQKWFSGIYVCLFSEIWVMNIKEPQTMARKNYKQSCSLTSRSWGILCKKLHFISGYNIEWNLPFTSIGVTWILYETLFLNNQFGYEQFIHSLITKF